jgi:hypothetical protein
MHGGRNSTFPRRKAAGPAFPHEELVGIWSAARIAALDSFGFLAGGATTRGILPQLHECDNHRKKIQSGDARRTPKIQKIHRLGAWEREKTSRFSKDHALFMWSSFFL